MKSWSKQFPAAKRMFQKRDDLGSKVQRIYERLCTGGSKANTGIDTSLWQQGINGYQKRCISTRVEVCENNYLEVTGGKNPQLSSEMRSLWKIKGRIQIKKEQKTRTREWRKLLKISENEWIFPRTRAGLTYSRWVIETAQEVVGGRTRLDQKKRADMNSSPQRDQTLGKLDTKTMDEPRWKAKEKVQKETKQEKNYRDQKKKGFWKKWWRSNERVKREIEILCQKLSMKRLNVGALKKAKRVLKDGYESCTHELTSKRVWRKLRKVWKGRKSWGRRTETSAVPRRQRVLKGDDNR